MIFKLRTKHAGQHVRAKLYVGDQEGSLALTGELCMRTSEWNTFISSLSYGLQSEDDKLIVTREEKDERN